jgi:hypothetical protein
MLADKMVELDVIASVSHETIRRTCTKRPAGGLEEGIVWVHLHRHLSGLTV